MAATDVVKLRVKVGVHELEAEGARDWVEAQLEAWKRLAGLGAANQPAVIRSAAAAPPELFAVDVARKLLTLRGAVNGRQRNADAALLILHGYRICFPEVAGNQVPATRLKASLAASGYRPTRFDRALAPHIAAGLIRKNGSHMHESYALTTAGDQRVAALLSQLSSPR